MPERFMLALMVLLVGWAASRFLQERALAELDTEAKAALLDRLAILRKYSPIFIIALVALIFTFPSATVPALVVYFASVVLLSRRRLQGLELPPSFSRNYWAGQSLLTLALLAYLAVIQGWIPVPP